MQTEIQIKSNTQPVPSVGAFQPLHVAPEVTPAQGEVIFDATEQSTLALPPRSGLLPRIGRHLLAALNGVMSYLIINLTSTIALLLFRVLTRTKVYGRWNIGLSKNTLLCSNHRTMIDSYLLGHLSSFPFGLLLPRVLPYHPAAQENFFRNRVIGWFSWRWRCIPVRRGVRDFEALQRMTDTLPKGQMLIFPEGTRSRDGELKEGRPGTGKLIHDTQCKVVPVYHRGMDTLLPIGTSWPRIFRKVEVNFGKPIDLSDLYALPSSKETSQRVIARVMEAIADLKAESEAREAARLPWYLALKRAFLRIAGYPLAFVRRKA